MTQAQKGSVAPQTQARQAAASYTCGKWITVYRADTVDIVIRNCANLTKTNRRWKQDNATEFFNARRDRGVDWTCGFSKGSGWDFTASASSEIEAGVIFAKATVTLTAEVSRHIESEDSAEASFRVKPRSYANCVRGAMTYDLAGRMRFDSARRSHATGRISNVKRGTKSYNYTANVPSFTTYRVANGRL